MNYTVSMQEVPGEVSLVFNMTDCGHRCKGCHSPDLQRSGNGLEIETYLDVIVPFYRDMVSCVCLMGDGDDIDGACSLLARIAAEYG